MHTETLQSEVQTAKHNSVINNKMNRAWVTHGTTSTCLTYVELKSWSEQRLFLEEMMIGIFLNLIYYKPTHPKILSKNTCICIHTHTSTTHDKAHNKLQKPLVKNFLNSSKKMTNYV